MQGEKIGEESGKVTSQRVLSNPEGGPKMETSFQASSTLLGAKATNRVPTARLFGLVGRCTARARESSWAKRATWPRG
jgi:hypothetical protein